MTKQIFVPVERWPCPDNTATSREIEVLNTLVRLIEETAQNLYDDVLQKSHVSNAALRQISIFFDPDSREFMQRPGNIYQLTKEYSDTLSEEENRLVYFVLVQIELKKIQDDDVLIGVEARKSGLDLAYAMAISAPIIEFYISKKLSPEFHKVPGYSYSGFFMRGPGLRPNSLTGAVKITEHMIYHGACALVLNALKLARYPDFYAQVQRIADREKLKHRNFAWSVVLSNDYDQDLDLYEFMPHFPKNSLVCRYFANFNKVVPAWIEISVQVGVKVETEAAVAIHSENNRCLVEFLDHTMSEPKLKYVISPDKPPMNGDVELQVYDNFEDAFVVWTAPEFAKA